MSQGCRVRIQRSYRVVTVRSPTGSAVLVPILMILSKAEDGRMRTCDVLREIRGDRWFPELVDEDRRAAYPASKKNILDSLTKYGRKDLTILRQLFPIGPECKQGWWKLTELGRKRARKEGGGGRGKYAGRAARLGVAREGA